MSSAAPAAAAPVNEPLLLRHDDGGIVTLTLNRPRQYNALSDALLGDLQSALDAIAGDAAARVVVIAGAGAAFCAGHDLKEMRARPDQGYYRDLFGRCSRMMLTIGQMPQPVIARVHGIATAAGCQLVAACDLAVAATEARFATSGINVGLFCSTPAVALSRNVPEKRLARFVTECQVEFLEEWPDAQYRWSPRDAFGKEAILRAAFGEAGRAA